MCLSLGTTRAWADSDDDLQNYGFLDSTPETIVSSARTPRPASKIAENVTVITSEQIEALNAHTLAEVLNTVAGFNLLQVRTPGSINDFTLDGATSGHIQLYIDGVPQADINETLVMVSHIPVQNIDRVEVIKGAASAAWGSALGGVINVITKSPSSQKASGSAFASIGSRTTSDTQAELTGTVDRFGYYLSGGYLNSDGLLPHNAVHFSNVYSKFVYDLPGNGSITAGLNYRNIREGIEEDPVQDFRDNANSRLAYYFANFNKRVYDRLTLDVNYRFLRQDLETRLGSVSTPDPFKDFLGRNLSNGGGLKLNWGGDNVNVTSGFEFEHVNVHFDEPVRHSDKFDKYFDRFGYYTNAAWSIDRFTLLPGIRFDETGSNGDLPSYTLGATYKLSDETVLRGYWARGYSLPKTYFAHGPQKVWTLQGGIESSELENLWVKATVFYNKTWNVEAVDGSGNLTNQIRQGFEFEFRTVPFYNFTVGASYTFADIRDEDTGHVIAGLPNQTAKILGSYENKSIGLTGVLTGTVVNWNRQSDGTKDQNPTWDLTLTKKVSSAENAAELFFSAHNIFDTPQYFTPLYKNAGRWFEGGVRCKF